MGKSRFSCLFPPPRGAALAKAVLANFGVEATLLRTEEVLETFQGKTAWEGEVGVFSVEHPLAAIIYAWAYTNDAGETKVVTVLGEDHIPTALEAIRAYIVSVARGGPE